MEESLLFQEATAKNERLFSFQFALMKSPTHFAGQRLKFSRLGTNVLVCVSNL